MNNTKIHIVTVQYEQSGLSGLQTIVLYFGSEVPPNYKTIKKEAAKKILGGWRLLSKGDSFSGLTISGYSRPLDPDFFPETSNEYEQIIWEDVPDAQI